MGFVGVRRHSEEDRWEGQTAIRRELKWSGRDFSVMCTDVKACLLEVVVRAKDEKKQWRSGPCVLDFLRSVVEFHGTGRGSGSARIYVWCLRQSIVLMFQRFFKNNDNLAVLPATSPQRLPARTEIPLSTIIQTIVIFDVLAIPVSHIVREIERRLAW